MAPALYDVIRAVSAVFPFKPTLDALDAALNDAGGLGGALLHLAALALAFGALSRLALRRFAGVGRSGLDSSLHVLPRHTPAPPAQDRRAARHGARDRAQPRSLRAPDVRPARARAGRRSSRCPASTRLSISQAVEDAGEAHELGIPAVLLFGLPAEKDEQGSGAYDDEGVVQLAVRALKEAHPELVVITDVCLCAYTSHGHCGVVLDDGSVDNDASLELLARTAASHARAGRRRRRARAT